MPSVLGLDLGRHTFRAVEIDKSKKGTILTRSGIYDNPKLNLDSIEKHAETEYSHAIRDFVRDSNFSTSKAVVALEEKDIFMRVINVPKMSDKELKSSISFEAEQYIPLPLKEVNLSYQKLELPSNQQGKVSVQLVAAKKTIVERYIHIVKDAKVTPIGVEPEALAVGRALSNKEDDTANVIIHFGYHKSLIVITLKGAVVFTRTLTSGGDAMTRALSQTLNLDYVQAEEYKKAYGLNADQAEGKIYDVLRPIFDSIVSEIGRAQVFFTTQHPGVNISKVLLSGGPALMPGLLLYMANSLSIEVELANPFKNITFSKEMEQKRDWHTENGPLFAVPVGLALKEL